MQGIEIYEENSDRLMLEQFILEHRSLVKKISLHIKKRLPSHIELDDILQAGFVGLLEARKQYKPDMGTAFDSYASIRIRGAIIDSLRKNSWGTRETMRNMRRITEAISRIEQRGQKQATSEEIAAELGISMDEHVLICQQISINNIVSIDMLDDENLLASDEDDNPSVITQKENIIQHIKDILHTLPEREQLVLSLYYIEELTFKQIGEVLELTEARICQLHSQAISKIKVKLDRDRL
ncbi:RNA polymerase sigma factor FliA [Aquicella siphonis]|uniref:RNA polymerase sigma factor FliA n=1 Tax=Aquicella siphonis TaxID=254247 RepID=A0A5E4PKN9_9COXI|nr:FliA/WhiG family RNA polymerase sigma factor [Aquicella siphonis]VVC77118.1 RNA polymerase sigma factor FliA [Aquicella siphonis]